MLRGHRNHSAFNSHNFPRTCTTTYLYSMLLCHSNRHAPTRDACRFGTYLVSSGCTYGLNTVSSTPSVVRSLSMPFQLRALHDPLRDYSPPILPLCIQYIQPTCRDCTPHVPRRLWKVAESNRLLIRGSLMSPPRGRTAVAFFSVGGSFIPSLPVCANYPGFYLPCLLCLFRFTSAASYHHTSRLGYSSLSEIGHRPTVCHASHH